MRHENPSDQELYAILDEAETIAVVGASSNPARPSHGIMQRLLAAGYRVFPVNPNEREVLGQKAYAKLSDVPSKIDIVDVFRRAEHTPQIADEAAAISARTLWLQSGVWNDEAADRAKRQGLTVVMDACTGALLSLLRVPKKR
jgi:predicted CoA-binding protein